MIRRHPKSTLFPYTTLFRSSKYLAARATLEKVEPQVAVFNAVKLVAPLDKTLKTKRTAMERALATYGEALDYAVDRKSTRLNSSHANISYAVFCLNKKTTILLAASLLLSSAPPAPTSRVVPPGYAHQLSRLITGACAPHHTHFHPCSLHKPTRLHS